MTAPSLRPSRARNAALVAVGGALGAVARYEILRHFPDARTDFPGGTLVVNCIGALALGLLLGWLDSTRGASAPSWVRPLALAGFLGAFTTLSLVVVDHAILITAGRSTEAFAFALITIVGTIAIALIGTLIGLRLGGGGAEGPA